MNHYYKLFSHTLLHSALFFLCFFALSDVFGQKFTQTIRGHVSDHASGHPIIEAIISLKDLPDFLPVTSDENGLFRMENVPAGRHIVKVAKPGFADYTYPDLELNAGKEVVLEVQMEEKIYEAEAVEITAGNIHDIGRVSTRVFTVEETKRYAAVYFDPARMAASYPGVVQGNDQANHLVVRGNSPNGVLWRMEGVDIVNPNHLTNAGTFTDRLTQAGGGTIILSTQLLTESSFSTGAFGPQFGNALSGVFDIHLRKGNEEKYEFTGQAGLIGIDLAAEGPLSKASRSSFLVNYRYSTVGLLSQMGISFGDEEIAFQDLSFNLSLPTKNFGNFTLFGIGGLSSNFFRAPRDTIRDQKDRFDIDFHSNMGAGGITHTLLLGEKSLLKSVVAVSAIDSDREGFFLPDLQTRLQSEGDRQTQVRFSATTAFTHKLRAATTLQAGIFLNRLGYEMSSISRPPGSTDDFKTLVNNTGTYTLLQPYARIEHNFTPSLNFTAGVHSMIFLFNNSRSLEPRLSLNWQASLRQSLRLAYGLHSQLQLPGTYFSTSPENPDILPNRNLGFTKAHHIVLSFNHQLSENLVLRLEPYYQHLYNVPIINQTTSTYSVLNLVEGYTPDSLENAGTGRNYGLEFSVEKYLSKNYYYLFSGSLYESKYTAGDGVERDTRFNGNYVFSLTGGREFDRITKKNKNKVLGLNMRLIYQGGFRAMPIDTAASAVAFTTVFDETEGFSERLPDYFRADLRITFKRNRQNYTRTFGIDIQNVTNSKNIAFQTYDTYLKQIVTKYQLGIIPLLSYRIEF
ncbi:MAG: TonB-dependent receptor [Bacteroidia bacterium]|nr:TonB-dependent receptor [Bacteroidia bacterium]